MRKTFKQYLAEGRTQSVDVQTLIKWMERNSMQFLDGGNPIYRGVKNPSSTIQIGTSVSSAPRKSTHDVPNIYTLWMDNHPSFKGTPRRGHSFIGTLNSGGANMYGEVHLLVPADANMIGFVGEDDIWAKGWRSKYDGVVSVGFDDLAKDVVSVLDTHKLPYDTWSQLSSSLKQIDTEKINAFFLPKSWFRQAYEDLKATGLYDMVDKIVNVKEFEFMTAADFAMRAPKAWYEQTSEVWVEGPSALIPLEDLSGDDRAVLIDWAKKNSPLLLEALNRPTS